MRILLPPREHGPPHVHVVKAGAQVVIKLAEAGRSVQLIRDYGMKKSDAVKAVRLVEIWNDELLAIWKAAHDE